MLTIIVLSLLVSSVAFAFTLSARDSVSVGSKSSEAAVAVAEIIKIVGIKMNHLTIIIYSSLGSNSPLSI